MSEPYLIAHVVSGSPAFDIAIRCDDMGTESDPAPWWIIPTSGHRAYPYWFYSFNDIYKGTSITGDTGGWWKGNRILDDISPPPADWPDHYSTLPAPKGQGLLSNLAEALGFALKPIKIRRR